MTLTDIYTPEWFAENREPAAKSAAIVAPLVKELLGPQSVLDVGCGQGEWLEAFGIEDSLGVDIAAPYLPGFLRHDLTQSLYLVRRFDLVLCLEVAEHLPESAADVLLDTLTRAGDTVLFSAAVPGQKGLHHVNCQPHSYWHEKFSHREYAVEDSIRPHIRYDGRVAEWYRRNTFVYRRR